MNPRQELIQLLKMLSVNKAAYNAYKLKCGKFTNVLIDASMSFRTQIGQNILKKLLRKFPEVKKATAVGGPMSGSEPMCAAIMGEYFINKWFGVRETAKGRGLDRGKITGPLLSQDYVILFEDVLTTGDSLIQAIEEVNRVGATILCCIVGVYRQEFDGCSKVQNALRLQTPLYSLTTKEELCD